MFINTLDCKGRTLMLDQPRICGIINVTPDSFADGGHCLDPIHAIEQGLRLIEEGADMLDIGGESTRPGAQHISVADELARIMPVIEALAQQTVVPLSVDTSKPEVMRAVVAAGAGVINDVYALRREGSLDIVAELGVSVCLMHMQGEPRTMQENPHYDDVLSEVHRFLTERIFSCQLAGIDKKRIIIDPGFGFGKNLQHNLSLLRGLSRFTEFGCPVLVGLSRKSMIGTLTQREPDQRVFGSVAAALIAVQNGASIVRVHDVAATRDALAIWGAVHADTLSTARTTPKSTPRWNDED